ESPKALKVPRAVLTKTKFHFAPMRMRTNLFYGHLRDGNNLSLTALHRSVEVLMVATHTADTVHHETPPYVDQSHIPSMEEPTTRWR
uniref:Uncharacterized protein n=1 Tax=Amphimedon queenslandica TaxID=400682 RepID=A0A1X7TJA8_AMPQE